MSARDIVIDERRAAFARIATRLRAAHKLLAECECDNRAQALNLDLPRSSDVLTALAATAKQFHAEHTP